MAEPAAWRSLLTADLRGWRMAGLGGFHAIADGTIESYGGPGLLWYAAATFDDFVVELDWRLIHPDDNSGLFLRIPPLADDIQLAIDQGYEVQIDDRAYDPDAQTTDSALHRTGASTGWRRRLSCSRRRSEAGNGSA
jgi:Domain of Unknown Function (DUF1080)